MPRVGRERERERREREAKRECTETFILHTFFASLPPGSRAWASSWKLPRRARSQPSVTQLSRRIQRLIQMPSPLGSRLCVSAVPKQK